MRKKLKMGRFTETESEATIREGTNRFMEYVNETRGTDEPYWHWSEKQRPHSEFNEESVSDYMWQRWGIR